MNDTPTLPAAHGDARTLGEMRADYARLEREENVLLWIATMDETTTRAERAAAEEALRPMQRQLAALDRLIRRIEDERRDAPYRLSLAA